MGISLGDDCIVEAGLYVTAGTLVRVTGDVAAAYGYADGAEVKAIELSGTSGILFRRNSLTGAVEALRAKGVELNTELHDNN